MSWTHPINRSNVTFLEQMWLLSAHYSCWEFQLCCIWSSEV